MHCDTISIFQPGLAGPLSAFIDSAWEGRIIPAPRSIKQEPSNMGWPQISEFRNI